MITVHDVYFNLLILVQNSLLILNNVGSIISDTFTSISRYIHDIYVCIY